MTLRVSLIAIALAIGSTAAQAACPPPPVGTTAETLAANQQRLLCLQNEIQERSAQRNWEFQIQSNQNAINDLELQRRLDAIPVIRPVQPMI